ncbi:hypothetical protein Ana3638_06630 [Anaerocolumna sedimenticola]|uniref:SatD family (SatD) n=1 Tax=Anaerocolumna sedimenticola TaxID=2696063 RepID=A0A6P1TLG0_9FIRM|nr:SatD family protein [Anaerocolumna sedimenticola]QHQ60485.1 hypothetical protein Ana3638_06630 [Anaerocolumna sedimenticola]
MQLYTALIADVKNSKTYDITERNKIQLYIKDCIDVLNCIFNPKMERLVIFSGGDELQGLFSTTVSAYLYLRLLSLLLFPVQIRAGLGVGAWTVKVENGSSTEQDGPAYHFARKAIEDVYGMQTQRYRIQGEKSDSLLNAILNASYDLCTQQSYLQNFTMLLLEYMYPFTDETNINADKFKALKNLIKDKYDNEIGLKGGKRLNSKNTRQIYRINDGEMNVSDKIWISETDREFEDMLLKKGMAAKISRAIGTTRQNVDKMIKNGNIIAIRSLDLAAIKYILKTYEEN